MMFCTNCGNKLKENSYFCTNCGSKINFETNLNDILVNESTETENNESSDETKYYTNYDYPVCDSYVPEKVSPSNPTINDDNKETKQDEVFSQKVYDEQSILSPVKFFGLYLLSFIPIIGLIFLVIFAFKKNHSLSFQNACKGLLILRCFSYVILSILFLVFTIIFTKTNIYIPFIK